MDNPKKLWKAAWRLLQNGQSEAKHPYRTPIVCTLSPTLHPRPRTLVLRKASEREGTLWCYTDRRSVKAEHLAVHPTLAWAFWSSQQGLQFTAHGPTEWLDQEATNERFRQLPKHSRKAYATLSSPGSFLNDAGDGLPEDWETRSLSETDYAAANFGILVTQLTHAEVLLLDKKGHRRLRAGREVGQEWQMEWIVP